MGKILDIKYPKASCFIDASLFTISTDSLKCSEIGLLIKNISKNLLSGNFDEVEKYSFITFIFNIWFLKAILC